MFSSGNLSLQDGLLLGGFLQALSHGGIGGMLCRPAKPKRSPSDKRKRSPSLPAAVITQTAAAVSQPATTVSQTVRQTVRQALPSDGAGQERPLTVRLHSPKRQSRDCTRRRLPLGCTRATPLAAAIEFAKQNQVRPSSISTVLPDHTR